MCNRCSLLASPILLRWSTERWFLALSVIKFVIAVAADDLDERDSAALAQPTILLLVAAMQFPMESKTFYASFLLPFLFSFLLLVLWCSLWRPQMVESSSYRPSELFDAGVYLWIWEELRIISKAGQMKERHDLHNSVGSAPLSGRHRNVCPTPLHFLYRYANQGDVISYGVCMEDEQPFDWPLFVNKTQRKWKLSAHPPPPSPPAQPIFVWLRNLYLQKTIFKEVFVIIYISHESRRVPRDYREMNK